QGRHASTPSRSGQHASPPWRHGPPRSCATALRYTRVWRPLCPVPTYCGEGRRSPGRRIGLVEKPLSLLRMVLDGQDPLYSAGLDDRALAHTYLLARSRDIWLQRLDSLSSLVILARIMSWLYGSAEISIGSFVTG